RASGDGEALSGCGLPIASRLPRPSPSSRLLFRSRRTPWTAPTPATAATVLRLRPRGGDAPEQRLNGGADLLLHHVPNDRQQAALPRHQSSLRLWDPPSSSSPEPRRLG